MTEAIQKTGPQLPELPADVSVGALEAAIGMGDFSRLTQPDRLKYLVATCRSIGVNPLTRPIAFIELDGRLVMYARKECSDQLRKLHGVKPKIKSEGIENGCYVVRVSAVSRDGQEDEDVGIVPIVYPETKWENRQPIKHPKAGQTMSGADFANAVKKAHTQAKRRVTLSIVGLGLMDESDMPERVTVTTDEEPAGNAQDRAAALNAEIVAEPVREPEPPAPASAPAPAPQPPAAAPEPVEAVVEVWPAADAGVGPPNLGPTLPAETMNKIEEVLGAHMLEVIAYLRAPIGRDEPWLVGQQTLEHLTPERAKRIIGKPHAVIAAATKGGQS